MMFRQEKVRGQKSEGVEVIEVSPRGKPEQEGQKQHWIQGSLQAAVHGTKVRNLSSDGENVSGVDTHPP